VMPEQEGLETIRQLRADLPHVRVVAMSGAFDGKFLNVARAFGADAVLQKPFDGRTVLATVSSLIGAP
jgi:DNA-binding NarL/FixJ family response regulator